MRDTEQLNWSRTGGQGRVIVPALSRSVSDEEMDKVRSFAWRPLQRPHLCKTKRDDKDNCKDAAELTWEKDRSCECRGALLSRAGDAVSAAHWKCSGFALHKGRFLRVDLQPSRSRTGAGGNLFQYRRNEQCDKELSACTPVKLACVELEWVSLTQCR